MTRFTLKIFVAAGDRDGLRLVGRSNGVGKTVFPRALLAKVKAGAKLLETKEPHRG